jgi:hypothetical protein
MTPHIYAFNMSFIQIFERFQALLQLVDGVNDPHINPLIHTIKKIWADVGRNQYWEKARKQRNFLTHEYPAFQMHGWEDPDGGWMTVEYGVGLVGREAERLLDKEILQVDSQLKALQKVS